MHGGTRLLASFCFLLGSSVSLAVASPYWKKGPTAPAGLGTRKDHAMAYDSTRNVAVLFGGTSGSTLKNDVWEYDGISWLQGPTSPGVPRAGHAMVYDSTRLRAVVFGGQAGTGYLKDVWEYSGTAWVQGIAAPAGLAARAYHAMAYDTARNVVVLFGGTNGASRFNDTWEYDGLAWTPGAGAPPSLTARAYHSMAFYPPGGVVVVFGGFDGANRNDTWTYDGVSWKAGPAAPAGLTARRSSAMAYDSKQGRIVLFGGFDGSVTHNDTWVFDGTSWSIGAPPKTTLLQRADHAMCKFQGGKVVLFGGNGTTQLSDTWEYKGSITDYIVGEGLGFPNPNRVRVYTAPAAVATAVDFYAYGAGQYGTNVAAAGIDDSVDSDMLTGPGPGAVYGPQVRGWFRSGSPVAKVNFYAYGTLKYGVNVAGGDIDGDKYAEIETGPGPGVVFGPTVRGWNYDAVSVTAIAKINFNAYSVPNYGVNVTMADLENDTFNEFVTGQGPGPSFAPEVRGFNFDNTSISTIAAVDFNAFSTIQYGVRVDGGDMDNDNFDEIVCAPGPGATLPARFLGFNFDNTAIGAMPGYDVTPFATMYGGRPGDGEVTGDATRDLLAGAGPDPAANSQVDPYEYSGTALTPAFPTFIPFGGNTYGVNATSGALGYY